jgi:hypothetical protein
MGQGTELSDSLHYEEPVRGIIAFMPTAADHECRKAVHSLDALALVESPTPKPTNHV